MCLANNIKLNILYAHNLTLRFNVISSKKHVDVVIRIHIYLKKTLKIQLKYKILDYKTLNYKAQCFDFIEYVNINYTTCFNIKKPTLRYNYFV